MEGFPEKKYIIFLYAITLSFIVISAVSLLYFHFSFSIIPAFLTILLISIFYTKKLFYFAVFFTPLSIDLIWLIPDIQFNLSLPTEPILIVLTALFFIRLLYDQNIDMKLLKHPLSISIYIYLTWILFTSITSTMPLVSFKFLIARIWFIVPFYFISAQFFTTFKKMKTYIWLYIIPFTFVMFYTIYKMWLTGFEQQAAYNAVVPFSNDHTSYAVVIAMFIPIIFGFVAMHNQKKLTRYFALFLSVTLIFALITSYTRAAWISLAGALCVWAIVHFKIRTSHIIATSVILLLIFFSMKDQIFFALEKNSKNSSTNFEQHIQSMANISTDASNVERINRWKCAIRMFNEKPLMGWGPGTYMFQYGQFQIYDQKTIISTNDANGGNSHSEYLGPLAESGVPGTVTFVLIITITIFTFRKVYRKLQRHDEKILALSTILGLITYYIHGFMNDFLDSDKASAPFWGFTAILVAFDLYYSGKNEEEENVKIPLEAPAASTSVNC
jgi:putative inorganic carbon (hco3(-)) transporter